MAIAAATMWPARNATAVASAGSIATPARQMTIAVALAAYTILRAMSASQLAARCRNIGRIVARSEEHTSELQSLMRISYAVFCLKKKKTKNQSTTYNDLSQ